MPSTKREIELKRKKRLMAHSLNKWNVFSEGVIDASCT